MERISFKEAHDQGLLVEGFAFKTNILGDVEDVMVGEVDNDKYYIWNNSTNGVRGKKNPNTRGFKFSWMLTFSDVCDFPKRIYVEYEPSLISEVVEEKGKKVNPNKSIEIIWSRKSGLVTFEFVVEPKITKFFEGISEEIKESKNWKGLKFYYCPKTIESPHYKELLSTYRLFDDYGSGIYRDGKLNIAWLRTVGGKGVIEVSEPITTAELSTLIKSCVAFLKEYLQETMQDFELTGTLSLTL